MRSIRSEVSVLNHASLLPTIRQSVICECDSDAARASGSRCSRRITRYRFIPRKGEALGWGLVPDRAPAGLTQRVKPYGVLSDEEGTHGESVGRADWRKIVGAKSRGNFTRVSGCRGSNDRFGRSLRRRQHTVRRSFRAERTK